MAVASRENALAAVRTLLGQDQVRAETVLKQPYLPTGLVPSADPSRMGPDTLIGGYGSEGRYVLAAADAETRRAIAGPPAETLAGHPTIRSETVTAYLTSSLDLTMQGGTTSGVVYPLAVCELAGEFRFRNVGGASAGAIAAAFTAAAELGRSGQVLDPQPAEAPSGPVAVRRGFTGMADVVGWLTQTGAGEPAAADEFRLAQLFRPGQRSVGVFRVVVALMRGQGWSLPVVALGALDRVTQVAVALVVGAAVVLTGLVEAGFTRADRSWPLVVAVGLLGVVAFTAVVVGVLLTVQGLRAVLARSKRARRVAPRLVDRLRSYSSSFATPARTGWLLTLPGLALLAGVVVLAFGWPLLMVASVLVGLAAGVLLTAALLRFTLGLLGRFRTRHYGLLAGTAPKRDRTLLDVAAGVPPPTVDASLVDWLDGCLTALAGLPAGRVLRFGHLWAGSAYESLRGSGDTTRLELLADDPDRRLVNLQLMATDLSRGQAHRFPLPRWQDHDAEQLWICLDDLKDGDAAVFGEPVLAALSEGEQTTVAGPDGSALVLYPLPQPWDLPVVFAVRLSMALPVLFQAVRLYRLVPPAPVSDDFGRVLVPAGASARATPAEPEELWFSDGGITSNFPVHFFDATLPRWPTVSLNLGPHPEDAPHQDVWLPQDWDTQGGPVRRLTASGLSFGSAVFQTSLSWRDSMQSALPGYRNRIAQVRTAPNEGGTNLFMPREVVASLALRGAIAGARLRTRFRDPTHWSRFRWLRLRTAVGNLETLRLSTHARRGVYADALDGEPWLDTLEGTFVDTPVTRPIPWYRPAEGFWPQAPQLLSTFADAHAAEEEPNLLLRGVPQPTPVLRQVPDD